MGSQNSSIKKQKQAQKQNPSVYDLESAVPVQADAPPPYESQAGASRSVNIQTPHEKKNKYVPEDKKVTPPIYRPPILRIPSEVLVQIATIVRKADLDLILHHERDWKRCFDAEARNPSVYQSWLTIRDSRMEDAAENLRNLRLVCKDFANAGAHAAIAVSKPASQPPILWGHYLPWEVDFCPWSQIVVDSSLEKAKYFLVVARNEILRRAVKRVKVVVRREDQTVLSSKEHLDAYVHCFQDALHRCVNIDFITAENFVDEAERRIKGRYVPVTSEVPQSILFLMLVEQALHAGRNITGMHITDIDHKFLPEDVQGYRIIQPLLSLAENLKSLEICFWQHVAPHYENAWPTGNARQAWKALLRKCTNLESLVLWNVPNSRRFTSTIYSHWGRFNDDVQLLKSLKTRKLRCLELVDVTAPGVLLVEALCQHATTLVELTLTYINLQPKHEAWEEFLASLKAELKLSRCSIETGVHRGVWEKYQDHFEIRDLVDKYAVVNDTRMREIQDIGSYLLPTSVTDVKEEQKANRG